MLAKYFSIELSQARQLIEQAKGMKWSQRGVDRHAYLIGDYAVLSTQRLKLRNVTTRDDQLTYLDELIESLLDLSRCGVSVVPILGYCYDPDSADGTGFLLEKRAKGQALFDDCILTKFQAWAESIQKKTICSAIAARKKRESICLQGRTKFPAFYRSILIGSLSLCRRNKAVFRAGAG